MIGSAFCLGKSSTAKIRDWIGRSNGYELKKNPPRTPKRPPYPVGVRNGSSEIP
jgi:hypothetical protein